MASPRLTSIRQNLQSLGGQPGSLPQPALAPTAPPGGQTEVLRRAQQAATGKGETGLAAPVASELERTAVMAEQQKTQDAQQQALSTASQVKRAATQLEKDTLDGLDQLTEQQASQVQQYRQKALSILDNLGRNKQQLSFAKQKSAVEQAGFLTRLSNKKYVDELQMAGRRQRLDNAAAFKSAVLENTFKEQEDLLRSDLSFRRALGADQREFTKYIASMTLDTALALATGQLQTQSQAGMYSGLSTLASTATDAYAKNNTTE